MEQIVVDIPYNIEISYTLYAKGICIEKPIIDDNEDFIHFKFQMKSIVILYYTFVGFRRAYIVTNYDDNKIFTTPVSLPGINAKLNVLYSARGRRIDHLKRAIYLLTKKDEFAVFNYPLTFWYRLAALIQFFGAKKSDIYLLNKQYEGVKNENN